MSHLIREARLSDVSELNQLTRQLGYPITEDDTKQNLQIILANENEIVYVMTNNEKVIAWIHIFHATRLESGSFCELGGLVVDSSFRGQGLGKILIEKAIQWSIDRKVDLLKLRSNVIRNDAHRFYRQLGFKEVKEQKMFAIQLQ
jgi:GNAT superfamily N-acetyltransferase